MFKPFFVISVAAFMGLGGMHQPIATAQSTLPGTRYIDQVFSEVSISSDLQYGVEPDLVTGLPITLQMDMYQPTGDSLAARPVLVMIHGGGFRVGGKRSMVGLATSWTQRGFVVLTVNYRLDPGNKCQDVQDGRVPPNQLAAEIARCTAAIIAAQHDSQAVVRWARGNASAYRLDPQRIAAICSSAGAVTAVNLAQRWEDPGTVGNFDSLDSRVSAALAMSGCQYDLQSISIGDAPISTIASEFDGAVPLGCVLETATTARRINLIADTLLYYGEGAHAIDLYNEHVAQVSAHWAQFLVDHLNLRSLLPPGSSMQIHGIADSSAVVSLVAVASGGPGYLQAIACGSSPGITSNLNVDRIMETRAGLAVIHFDASGTACVYNSGLTNIVVDLQGYLQSDSFEDVVDERLLDTRLAGFAVGVRSAATVATATRPIGGSMIRYSGRANADAVIVVVAVDSGGPGYVQALACGSVPGTTSNVNTSVAHQTVSGLAIVHFDNSGNACLFTSASTHLIADLQGYLTAGSFDDTAAERLLDTRLTARVAAGSMTQLAGVAGSSAVVTITAVDSANAGYVQVLSCTATPGESSNLNTSEARQTIAATAVVQFDDQGTACLFNSFATDLVVDLQGYLAAGAFDDVVDVRLLDTRAG